MNNIIAIAIDIDTDACYDTEIELWYLQSYAPEHHGDYTSKQFYKTVRQAKEAYFDNKVIWEK